jgi:hypothetical protein
MPGLDGHQIAEPVAEHKDWPDPRRATGGEENDAKPANGIPIDRDRTAVPAPFQPLADATRIRPGRWTAVLATMVALRQFCPSGIGVGRPLVCF